MRMVVSPSNGAQDRAPVHRRNPGPILGATDQPKQVDSEPYHVPVLTGLARRVYPLVCTLKNALRENREGITRRAIRDPAGFLCQGIKKLSESCEVVDEAVQKASPT
jgi:hypothetical protein